MAKRLKEKVKVNGRDRWIDGYSIQELMDNYVRLLEREGLVKRTYDQDVPFFGDYILSYIQTYKQDQESLTKINRERIVKNHILPKFNDWRISDIRVSDLQQWFNDLGSTYSRETLLKIKNTMSPVLDAAVEDNYILKNPMRSTQLVIGGKDTKGHVAIPRIKMDSIKNDICNLTGQEKRLAALLCYTGMRFEEILGVRWEDIQNGKIYIRRAVVHPTRNSPEVKSTKTRSSERVIPLHPRLKEAIGDQGIGYILASKKDETCETPLSYTEARNLFKKIRERYDLQGYSAHDFRDTCATEWRENGMPLDIIARLLGHSKTETTEKRYVKYREESLMDIVGLM